MEYDYDHPKFELPLEYARALVNAAEEVNRIVQGGPDIYGGSFAPERLTFWDGSSGGKSEWFIDVHDGTAWVSLASRIDKEN